MVLVAEIHQDSSTQHPAGRVRAALGQEHERKEQERAVGARAAEELCLPEAGWQLHTR